jgi:hypothetical protein
MFPVLRDMNMNAIDVSVAYAGIVALFIASILIGHEILKKNKTENEAFERGHAEDAMRIKAKHYRNGR